MSRTAWIVVWTVIATGCASVDDDARPVPSPYMTAESAALLMRGTTDDTWTPRAAPRPPLRGALYDRVAPAVVVVRTRYGHGTGFLVRDSGLVVTAHHVIADGWAVDRRNSATFVQVHLGELRDGLMLPCREPVPGFVVAVDPKQDLALLRLDPVPPDCGDVVAIDLADRPARPEDPIVMIGHASSATLWSCRPGVVTGVGKSPRDLVDWLVYDLGLPDAEREAFADRVEMMGDQDIVVTDCGSSHGDSGGPLVDLTGRLVGVTSAVPAGVAAQKFTYHVTADHVRELLDDYEASAGPRFALYVPDPYRVIGPWLTIKGSAILTAAATPDGLPSRFLFDLDGDTPPDLIRNGDFVSLVDGRRFDAEVAVHMFSDRNIVFYDTDNQDGMDTIFVYKEDARAELRFEKDPGSDWRLDDRIAVPFLDASVLEVKRLRNALVRARDEAGLGERS